jgi:hypothetical protein
MYSRGYRREVDVLRQLQRTLPDGYEFFHCVDWHSLHHGQDCHSEIDLVVMNQAGIETALINCQVLPDFTPGYDYIVAIPRERIFDANDFSDQSLYSRTPFDVPDAASIHCMDNFRRPWVGDFPEIHQYDGSVDDLPHPTGLAIDAYIPISDIAVLSNRVADRAVETMAT